MKAFVAALFLLAIGDFAINHGNGTHQAMLFVSNFAASASQAVSESVFSR